MLGIAACRGLLLSLVAALTGACSMVHSLQNSDIKVPTFFPESPDAGPQATAPAELAVPGDQHLVLVLVGSGYQNYECREADGRPSWVLLGPDATLYSSDHLKVGTHAAGPVWTYQDGSAVHGTVKMQAPSRAERSVPQLLLSAHSDDHDGVFKGVTYVQRLRTVGGLAPDYGCDTAHLGAKLGRQYSAFYLFYKPLGVN